MREFHRAVQERGEESTRSDGGDSGNPTPPSVLPLAVIPTLKVHLAGTLQCITDNRLD